MERGWFWLYPCSPSLRKYTLDKWYYFQLLITLIFHETKGKKVPELSRFFGKVSGEQYPISCQQLQKYLAKPPPCVRILAAAVSLWLGKMFANWEFCTKTVLSGVAGGGDQRGRCQQSGAALHSTVQYRPGTACQSLSPISVSRHSLTSSTSDISIITIHPITSCHYWTTDDTPQTS